MYIYFVFFLYIFFFRCFAKMSNTSMEERLSALERKIEALTKQLDQQDQRAPYFLNYNEGHHFQAHTVMPSNYHSGWRPYEDFSYRS